MAHMDGFDESTSLERNYALRILPGGRGDAGLADAGAGGDPLRARPERRDRRRVRGDRPPGTSGYLLQGLFHKRARGPRRRRPATA